MNKTLLATALVSILSVTYQAQAVEAYKAGDMLVRGGLTIVVPDNAKTPIDLNYADSSMTLTVDEDAQLGLNFVYFLDQNFAIEVLAATPFTHDVTIQDKGGVLGVNGAKLAEVTHLPPTVSALYYFNTSTTVKPYVGVGLNYTIFFDEEFEKAPQNLGLSDLELDGSFGLAFQAGVDFLINDNWHLNASVRYIDINSDATFDFDGKVIGAEPMIGTASIDVDPIVYSVMVGYKF